MSELFDDETGEIKPPADGVLGAFALYQKDRMRNRPRKISFQYMVDNWTMPEPNSGCWLWTGLVEPTGYVRLSWKAKMTRAHRVSWQHFKGAIPAGLCVLHKCDVRSCVNPDHLFLGTQQDNMTDRKKKGRYKGMKGVDHPRAKLSEDDVRMVRAALRDRGNGKKLARMLGVDSAIIYRIWNGTLWESVL